MASDNTSGGQVLVSLLDLAAELQRIASAHQIDIDEAENEGKWEEVNDLKSKRSALNSAAQIARQVYRSGDTEVRSPAQLAQFIRDAFNRQTTKTVPNAAFGYALDQTQRAAHAAFKSAQRAPKRRSSFDALIATSPVSINTSTFVVSQNISNHPEKPALISSSRSEGFQTTGRGYPPQANMNGATQRTNDALASFDNHRSNSGINMNFVDLDLQTVEGITGGDQELTAVYFRVLPPESIPGMDYSQRRGNEWAGEVLLTRQQAESLRKTFTGPNGARAISDFIDSAGRHVFGEQVWHQGIPDQQLPTLGPRFESWNPREASIRLATEQVRAHETTTERQLVGKRFGRDLYRDVPVTRPVDRPKIEKFSFDGGDGRGL